MERTRGDQKGDLLYFNISFSALQSGVKFASA